MKCVSCALVCRCVLCRGCFQSPSWACASTEREDCALGGDGSAQWAALCARCVFLARME